jgi:hypothetical protein
MQKQCKSPLLQKADSLSLILDSLKKITELELEVQEQLTKLNTLNYNTEKEEWNGIIKSSERSIF